MADTETVRRVDDGAASAQEKCVVGRVYGMMMLAAAVSDAKAVSQQRRRR